MVQALLGILVLSFLVLLHELGHFIAAKALKIPVLVFSIGFGKPLIKKRWGETEYRIAPILFGGFVQMEGDEPGKVTKGGFNARPVSHRAIVAIAGPAVNLVSAFVFLVIMYATGVPFASYLDTTIVGSISDNSPALGKLLSNDTIISVNGKPVTEWEEVDLYLKDLSSTHTVVFKRSDKIDTTSFSIAIPDPDNISEFDHGIMPFLPSIVGSVTPQSPADLGGLLVGDSITAINAVPVNSWYEIPDLIANLCKDSAVHLVFSVENEGPHERNILPEFNKEYGRYIAGFGPQAEYYIRKYEGSEILVKSAKSFKSFFFMIFDVLGKLFTGGVSVGHLSGPLAIIMISGTAAQAGIAALLKFMALISVNLGVLNLMPLVITDGGILSLLLIETIMRKPVPEKVQQNLAMAFTVAFITLFVIVSFHDIVRFPMFINK